METVLLLPHTNTYYCSLTRVRSGFWNRMVHLSLSSALQLPDFKQTCFPLLSSSDWYLFFCLNSSHKALHGQCSVCLLPGLSRVWLHSGSQAHINTQDMNADSNVHTLQVWIHSERHTATHSARGLYVVTYRCLAYGNVCDIHLNEQWQTWSTLRGPVDVGLRSESPVTVSCPFLFSLGVCRT